MRKFIQKNKVRITIFFLSVTAFLIGVMKYVQNSNSDNDFDKLERERRSNESRVRGSIDRVNDTVRRADDIKQQITERYRRIEQQNKHVQGASDDLSTASERLERTSNDVEELDTRIQCRIERNRELLQRLSDKRGE